MPTLLPPSTVDAPAISAAGDVGPLPQDARQWSRGWTVAGLVVLALVLAVAFDAWLSPDMLLELSSLMLCS